MQAKTINIFSLSLLKIERFNVLNGSGIIHVSRSHHPDNNDDLWTFVERIEDMPHRNQQWNECLLSYNSRRDILNYLQRFLLPFCSLFICYSYFSNIFYDFLTYVPVFSRPPAISIHLDPAKINKSPLPIKCVLLPTFKHSTLISIHQKCAKCVRDINK